MRMLSDAELAQLLDKDIFHKISAAADSLHLETYVVGGYVRDLFPSLSPQEQAVANLLSKHGDMQADTIAAHLSLSIPQLTPLLFALEMKGVVRLYAGGIYHFIS